jgi:hypothetical protein
MCTDRGGWAARHPRATPHRDQTATCPCGQELDDVSGDHCPRCGSPLPRRVVTRPYLVAAASTLTGTPGGQPLLSINPDS